MNIFETIRRANSRIEPYHSQFLADALEYSLKADRFLFDAVWELAAPSDWEIPVEATVSTEEVVEKGRIDVCIRTEKPQKRVLGIEVKTNDASARSGQLTKYLEGLNEKFTDHEIQISYLTPFNSKQAGDAADSLPTIKEFKKFASDFPRSRHFSWLDVADIPWDGNELWKQHQAYVRRCISSLSQLQAKKEMNRDFAVFFGKELANQFTTRLSELGIIGTNIDLAEFIGNPSFAKSFADAFAILLDAPNVSRKANKDDRFSDELKKRFLESDFGEIHTAIFDLSRKSNFVWVNGIRDYGIRTAYRNRSNGVSLLTSNGPGQLLVGQPR